MSQKYFKTTYVVEVLSEDAPASDLNLQELHDGITTGDWSGVVKVSKVEEVDAATMKALLIEQHSDPAFFGLDEDEEDN